MRNQLSRRACVNTPGTGSTPAPVVAPPDLHETLGQFSEALCLAETTWRAFEAAEDRGEIATAGVHITALGVTVRELRRIYSQFDLAIGAARPPP